MDHGMQEGFTLIELMSVVAIIGILAAIALPAYQDHTARAQLSEAFSLLGGVRTSVAEHLFLTGALPEDNAIAGLDEPEFIAGNYVTSVEVTDQGVRFQIANDAASPIRNGLIVIKSIMGVADDTIVRWRCSSDDIAPRFFPTSCRP